jgi:LytS/YehU family sensor histidine kinase
VITVGKMTSDDMMTPMQIIADQAVNGYFFFICWATLYLALCYAAEVGALERRAAALRAAAQAAELRALRYQVNPHFLFNTLNSLSSLVLSGKREEAEQMIINLATFFRTSLTGDPTEDVPLAEEIRLQRLYLDIERVRFPERLLVEVDIPYTLNQACIPGLILQPLIENAVKYGVSRVTRPVTIRIAAGEVGGALRLVVEDDGDPVGVDAAEGGTGVGLRNVRDRLRARFGSAARVRWGPRAGGGFAVSMTMPLVLNNDC